MLPEVGDVGGSARDCEEMPLAGYTLERVRTALLELQP